MRHPLSALLAPPQPPSSQQHNSQDRAYRHHHHHDQSTTSERVSPLVGCCDFAVRASSNQRAPSGRQRSASRLVLKKRPAWRAAPLLHAACLLALLSLLSASQLLSASKLGGQQATATTTTTAGRTNCQDQFSQKSQRQGSASEAQQQPKQPQEAIRPQQQQPDDLSAPLYAPQTSQARAPRDNGRPEPGGGGENGPEQCADCLAIPLVALMGGRQLNGFLVQQLKRRRPSQLAPLLASFAAASPGRAVAGTVLAGDQLLQEPPGGAKSSASFGGYSKEWPSGPSGPSADAGPDPDPDRGGQQQTKEAGAANDGPAPLAPHSDDKCPMTGALTVCDQIDSYPADEILHKLEAAQKSLKQTYFNLDSLFSDERDHSSEPFDSLSALPAAAAAPQTQDGLSDQRADVVAGAQKDSPRRAAPAAATELYESGFDTAPPNNEDEPPTANSSAGASHAAAGRENELELGLTQRQAGNTKTGATIASAASPVDSYRPPEGASTFQRAPSGDNQAAAASGAQLDTQPFEFGGRKQAAPVPLAPPPPTLGHQYHQPTHFNRNQQQQQQQQQAPMMATSPFDDFVDIVERRAISIAGDGARPAKGAAANTNAEPAAAGSSLAAAGRYKAAPADSAPAASDGSSAAGGRDKYYPGNEQQHRRQQPMFISAPPASAGSLSRQSSNSSLADRLLARSRPAGQQLAYEANQAGAASAGAQLGALQEGADNSLAATNGALTVGGRAGSQPLDPLQAAASTTASGANFRLVKPSPASAAPAARSPGAGSGPALRLSRSRRQVSATVRVSSIGGGSGGARRNGRQRVAAEPEVAARTTTTTTTSSFDDRTRNTSEQPSTGERAGAADAAPSISGDGNGGGADQSQPEPVCRAKSIYISPKAALNDKKQWKYVVNAPERNPQIRQIIRVDICQDPFGPCSDQVSLPFGFSSRCKQKYSKKKLLALDSQSGLLEVDTFFIPSCCVCQLVRARDDSLEEDSAGSGEAGSNEMVAAAAETAAEAGPGLELAEEATEAVAGGRLEARAAAAAATSAQLTSLRTSQPAESAEARMELEDLADPREANSSGAPADSAAGGGDDVVDSGPALANSVASSPFVGERSGARAGAESPAGKRASGSPSDQQEH